jgi:hypothetical protein
MVIFTIQAVCQFVGQRFAHDVGSGRKQHVYRSCVARCGSVSRAPIRITRSCNTPGDVEHVFDTDTQALERANGSASHIEHAVRDERTRRIILAC